jgi:hypothetical protein
MKKWIGLFFALSVMAALIVVTSHATDSTATFIRIDGAPGGSYVKADGSGWGTPAGSSGVASINTVTGAFTFTGAGVSCTSTTCTFSGTGSGVTSVAMTAPSWLSVAGSPVTTTGTLAVTAATGQTSHKVIGTCGSATSFGSCSLVAGDLPATIGPATTFLTNAEFSNGTCTTAKTIDPVNGNKQTVTLTNGSTCALTFTQPASGTATVQLKITQSAVSTFNGGISGCKWPGGVVPTITQTTGAVDMLSVYLDGTNAYCQIAQAFS